MTNEEKFKTPEERAKAFDKFCNGRKCEACPMVDMGTIYECAYSWLALEAGEEEPMPCPFCGGKTKIRQGVIFSHVECPGCHCHSPDFEIPYTDDAISEHNRVCRAVKAVKEGSAK